MPLYYLAILVAALFLSAYFLYGRLLIKRFGLNDNNPTPAIQRSDGFDYVPTSKGVLLAQHFASIAAAGPVVGPIVAGLAFGWAPTLLWILLGCIFIGACHDGASLVASVRHGAKSIPEMARAHLGNTGYRLSLAFIWLCLVYVIIAFTDVTAQQFVAKEEWGGGVHDVGGGVATSSILYLVLAVLMGVALRLKMKLGLATVIFFPLLIGIILLGQYFPIVFSVENPIRFWSFWILLYCALASVLPMWLLLQPRGYLGGYFLYIVIACGILGLLMGGFSAEYPAYRGFISMKGESLYPFLFITVACGACSGFHGLVCSGTTSKQLSQETHAPLVGYGGMLLEGLVAVLALSTVMMWPQEHSVLSKSPSEIYATGIAHFTKSTLGLPVEWGLTFGMLAFATFVYDTLDCATRLGRYLVEEFFGWRGKWGHLSAVVVTLALPLIYVWFTPSLALGEKRIPLWATIWPLFGSSNQLLAALTLSLLVTWLLRSGKSVLWILIPAGFMFFTSSFALFLQMKSAFTHLVSGGGGASLLNVIVAGALLILSFVFAISCLRVARSPKPNPS